MHRFSIFPFSLFTAFCIIMFGLDIYDFFQFGLIKIFACILEDIFGFFFKDLKQKHWYHILKFRVFTKISLVVDSILYFFIVKETCLSFSQTLVTNDIMLVIMLFSVVHVVDVVLVKLFLLLLLVLLWAHWRVFYWGKKSFKKIYSKWNN